MAPWLEDIIDTLRNLFSKLLGASFNAVHKAIADNADKIEGDAYDYFKDAARRAVAVGAQTPGSYVVRGETALASFVADIATNGITMATNILKILLEDAYAEWLKDNESPEK